MDLFISVTTPTPSQISGKPEVHLIRAIAFSSYTLLVWDYFLTLDDEIRYIWESPSSFVKYLFLSNRYAILVVQPITLCQLAGVITLHSSTGCLVFFAAVAIFQLWSYGSVQFLVLMRIWILHGRTRKITIMLIIMLALYGCSCIAGLTYMLGTAKFSLDPASAGKCGVELAPFSWLLWIIECTLETCLFGLMIYTLRKQKFTAEFSRTSHLVRSLYRHAIIFFLANTLGDIANIVAWNISPPILGLPESLPITLVNITGQRLAIDLRRLHVQKEVTRSQVSREVEIQLAAMDIRPGSVP